MFIVASLLIAAATAIIVRAHAAHCLWRMILSAWLLVIANIVLSGYVLSLLGLLNSKAGFIAAHSAILVAACLVCVVRAKAAGPTTTAPPRKLLVASDKEANLRTFDVMILMVGAAVIQSIVLVIGLSSPPNNPDSLWHHLPRVMYWLQNGNMLPWESSSIVVQQTYPPVMQLLQLWLFLFVESERVLFLPQWFAGLATAVAVFATSRQIGASNSGAKYAAALVLTLPQLVLQSSETQNHLFASSLLVSGVAFYLSWIQRLDRASMAFSAMALGLLYGTHLLATFFLPGLCVSLLLIAAMQRKWRPVLVHAVATAGAFAVLGSYIYIQNFIFFGSITGPHDFWYMCVDPYSYFVSSLRYFYQFIDADSLPTALGDWVQHFRFYLFRLLQQSGIEIEFSRGCEHSTFSISRRFTLSENMGYFGLAQGAMIACGLLACVKQGVRDRNPIALAFVITALSLYVVHLTSYWHESSGRYFLLIVLLISAWAAFIHDSMYWPMRKGRSIAVDRLRFGAAAGLRYGVVTLSLISGLYTILFSDFRPAVGEKSIWTLSRLEMMTIRNPDRLPHFRFIEETIPPGKVLGFAGSRRFAVDFEYLYFGENQTRYVIPVADPATKVPDVVDYLVVHNSHGIGEIPAFELIQEGEGYRVFRRN